MSTVTTNLATEITKAGAKFNWNVTIPAWGKLSPITYANSNKQFTSSTMIAPYSVNLYITVGSYNSSNHTFTLYKNGATTNLIATNTVAVNKNDSIYMRAATNSNKSATSGTVVIKLINSSGTQIDSFSYSLAKTSTCYLTSTMVEYYGLDDDGPQLTAMRALREVYKDKHAETLIRYEEDSQIIISGIENTENPEFYYDHIRQIVDNIVILVSEENWESAEQLYLNLYYELRSEFIGG